MKMSETLGVLLICGLLSLVANVVGTKFGFFEAIPGMLFLIVLAFIGIWLGKVMPGGIPGVAYVVTIGDLSGPAHCGSYYGSGFQGWLPAAVHPDPGLCRRRHLQRSGCIRGKQLAYRCGKLCGIYRHLHRFRYHRPADFEGNRTDLTVTGSHCCVHRFLAATVQLNCKK